MKCDGSSSTKVDLAVGHRSGSGADRDWVHQQRKPVKSPGRDIHSERAGWSEEQLTAALAGIGRRTAELLATADDDHVLPLAVAEAMASARLGRTVTVPD